MGTLREHGQTGQPEPGAGEKSCCSEFQSSRVARFGGTHHGDGEAFRWMRTFYSFKRIFITYTGAIIASIPLTYSIFKNHPPILNGSCHLRCNIQRFFPFSRSKVTYLNLRTLDGLITLLLDSIHLLPSLKSINFPFALVHHMLAMEYSREDDESSVSEKIQEMGETCENFRVRCFCADVMVAVFLND